MTGYSGNASAYFNTTSGTKIPWITRRAIYIIHDAERLNLNLTSPYIIGKDVFGGDDHDGNADYSNCGNDIYDNATDISRPCQLAMDVSKCKQSCSPLPSQPVTRRNLEWLVQPRRGPADH